MDSPTIPVGRDLQLKAATLRVATEYFPLLLARIEAKQRTPKAHSVTDPVTIIKLIDRALRVYPMGEGVTTLSHERLPLREANGMVADALILLESARLSRYCDLSDHAALSAKLSQARVIVGSVYKETSFRFASHESKQKAGNRPQAAKSSPVTLALANLPVELPGVNDTVLERRLVVALVADHKEYTHLPPVGMACPLPTVNDGPTPPLAPANFGQLADRRYTLERALDELAIVDVSGNIEDLAGLLGLLEGYASDSKTQYLYPTVFRVDGFVLNAKGVSWRLMNLPGPGPLPAQQIARIRESLEAALGLLLSVIYP